MSGIRRYLAVEWKLWGRGPLVWFLLLLVAGVYGLVAFADPDDVDIGRFALQQSMFLFPVFLTALLLAMHVVRREEATRNGPLIAALPYRSSLLIAAKLLGIGLPLTLLTWIPAAWYAVKAAGAGVPAGALGYGALVLLSSAVPLWYMIALGAVIGAAARKRWSYILGVVVFLVLTYGVNLFLPYWAPYMQIADFTRMSFFYPDSYSKVWGFSRDPVFWMNRAFYLLITAGLVILTIALARTRRGERRLIAAWRASCAACFAAAAVIAAVYAGVWLERMAQIEREYAVYQSLPDASRPAGSAPAGGTETGLAASDYDLDVALAGGAVKVKAGFMLTNVSDKPMETAPVTLRHLFAVDSVAVDGSPVNWHREPGSDALRIDLNEPLRPGESIAVEIGYAGQADIWRREGAFSGFQYRKTYFADRNAVLLPGMIGWYPLAGERTLASVSEVFGAGASGDRGMSVLVLRDAVTPEPETNFAVRIESPYPLAFIIGGQPVEPVRAGRRYVAEAKAEGVSGLSLIGGELKAWTDTAGERKVTLITGVHTEPDIAGEMTRRLARLTEWLEEEMPAIWGENITRRFRPQETFMFADWELPDPYHTTADGTLVPAWDSMNGVVFLPRYALNPDVFESVVFPYLFNRLMAGNRADARATEFHEALRAYLHRKYEGGHGPLSEFEPRRIAELVNRIYDQSDDARFRAFLRDYFELISGSGGMSLQEREAFIRQYLSGIEGERT